MCRPTPPRPYPDYLPNIVDSLMFLKLNRRKTQEVVGSVRFLSPTGIFAEKIKANVGEFDHLTATNLTLPQQLNVDTITSKRISATEMLTVKEKEVLTTDEADQRYLRLKTNEERVIDGSGSVHFTSQAVFHNQRPRMYQDIPSTSVNDVAIKRDLEDLVIELSNNFIPSKGDVDTDITGHRTMSFNVDAVRFSTPPTIFNGQSYNSVITEPKALELIHNNSLLIDTDDNQTIRGNRKINIESEMLFYSPPSIVKNNTPYRIATMDDVVPASPLQFFKLNYPGPRNISGDGVVNFITTQPVTFTQKPILIGIPNVQFATMADINGLFKLSSAEGREILGNGIVKFNPANAVQFTIRPTLIQEGQSVNFAVVSDIRDPVGYFKLDDPNNREILGNGIVKFNPANAVQFTSRPKLILGEEQLVDFATMNDIIDPVGYFKLDYGGARTIKGGNVEFDASIILNKNTDKTPFTLIHKDKDEVVFEAKLDLKTFQKHTVFNIRTENTSAYTEVCLDPSQDALLMPEGASIIFYNKTNSASIVRSFTHPKENEPETFVTTYVTPEKSIELIRLNENITFNSPPIITNPTISDDNQLVTRNNVIEMLKHGGEYITEKYLKKISDSGTEQYFKALIPAPTPGELELVMGSGFDQTANGNVFRFARGYLSENNQLADDPVPLGIEVNMDEDTVELYSQNNGLQLSKTKVTFIGSPPSVRFPVGSVLQDVPLLKNITPAGETLCFTTTKPQENIPWAAITLGVNSVTSVFNLVKSIFSEDGVVSNDENIGLKIDTGNDNVQLLSGTNSLAIKPDEMVFSSVPYITIETPENGLLEKIPVAGEKTLFGKFLRFVGASEGVANAVDYGYEVGSKVFGFLQKIFNFDENGNIVNEEICNAIYLNPELKCISLTSGPTTFKMDNRQISIGNENQSNGATDIVLQGPTYIMSEVPGSNGLWEKLKAVAEKTWFGNVLRFFGFEGAADSVDIGYEAAKRVFNIAAYLKSDPIGLQIKPDLSSPAAILQTGKNWVNVGKDIIQIGTDGLNNGVTEIVLSGDAYTIQEDPESDGIWEKLKLVAEKTLFGRFLRFFGFNGVADAIDIGFEAATRIFKIGTYINSEPVRLQINPDLSSPEAIVQTARNWVNVGKKIIQIGTRDISHYNVLESISLVNNENYLKLLPSKTVIKNRPEIIDIETPIENAAQLITQADCLNEIAKQMINYVPISFNATIESGNKLRIKKGGMTFYGPEAQLEFRHTETYPVEISARIATDTTDRLYIGCTGNIQFFAGGSIISNKPWQVQNNDGSLDNLATESYVRDNTFKPIMSKGVDSTGNQYEQAELAFNLFNTGKPFSFIMRRVKNSNNYKDLILTKEGDGSESIIVEGKWVKI